ncbi:cation ABC transporter substrate-binding protein [Aliarcobacter trophiarum LMG 25534]|uniref:Cation ABC transporter substrate-binding protein n=1 Tax=Aliarcobacter trophiarum LMG 25534 TaxID=1032241 RepID=A0AAD0QI63_9BACT|nr:zinc ABC transporter substrate-binding protein [Aliarcobacter trophiarum]AXK48343.1 metal ion ABC transporter, periplasmic metal-binding protein [Aliarcobacter trophiarum LMG 25534]RXJ92983.1 cation ABC transporter substrate-binding protein [Aliarcobacter trophiarum LMG 25534]
MRNYLVIFILFTTVLFASKQELTVTILPQKYFVQKIVKDKFNINVMIKPGSSPHNFEPKASQMKALSSSKIYFMIGEPSEKAWISRFKQNAKNTLFVDTTIGVEKIAMQEHTHHEDEHDKHDNHIDENGLDPHIWLDPISVKNQAKNIYEAVIKIDEKNSEFYKTNYNEFINELENLDKDIKKILTPYKDKAFMVFHPSWGYFAVRYDLEQISIEIEGKEPKPNELLKLIEDSKEHNIKIVFVSPQFSQKSAKTISQNIGASVVSIDPLNEDWQNNLLFVADEIAKSYRE